MNTCLSNTLSSDIEKLRASILSSPVDVAIHRAQTYTRVFRENPGSSFMINKARALKTYWETVPLYLRDNDRIAGTISERPGAMPVFVEIGMAENAIYTGENPHRRGYLKGKIPADIMEFWHDRNLWGHYRAHLRDVLGREQQWHEVAGYKFISCQGHLSPDFTELMQIGIAGLIQKLERYRQHHLDPRKLEFLQAASLCLEGFRHWIIRYADFLHGLANDSRYDNKRRAELMKMSEDCRHLADNPPVTFSQAIQLGWFAYQAIHIEGHGYSGTPDRIDQWLYPFYLRDREAGRITREEALHYCENWLLKMRDNTVWGVEHNLTQGICLGGSTPDGEDQTNELSWLFIEATEKMALPEPLVWIRWHPNIDRDFFDFCLQNIAGRTCFPLIMSDTAVPAMLMELGVERNDAYNYVAAGCNELAIPGKAYFNPGANCSYLSVLEDILTRGRGYRKNKPEKSHLPPPDSITSFDQFFELFRQELDKQIASSYAFGLHMLVFQMRYAQTPFTSIFFHGCIEEGHDMIEGTRYNIMSCGGTQFANAVDALAVIRQLVFQSQETTLSQLAEACAANWEGYAWLHAKVKQVPKHGNGDPSLYDIVKNLEQARAEAVRRHCRDLRDGTPYGNTHIVRSGAVRGGRASGATPDGRRAGEPFASSVAAANGCEKNGPTAVINSLLMLDPVHAWQSGYNVNLRFQNQLLRDKESRPK
ncbi:MAG: hypothetical protein D6820_02460, partial [Lentisphaerae bacterium]